MTDGLIINGARVPVPGVEVVTWLDDPTRAPLVTDGHARDPSKVTGIVLHTSRGRRGTVRPGSFPSTRAETLARYQSRTDRDVSWHLTVDTDGTVIQQADAATWMAWHAAHANGWSVGIECVQQPDSPDLYAVQVAALVAVVEALCAALRIPRRTIVGADGHPYAGIVRALQERSEGGRQGSFAGVIGHRALTTRRGVGDPGDDVFAALLAAGFEGVPPPLEISAPHAARPTAPEWLDADEEHVDTADLVTTPEAFVRDSLAHLAALGVTGDRALEVVAHCATECSWGRRAIAHNAGGVKLSQTDNRHAKRATGHGLPWWRSAGHIASGDEPEVYYRAFPDAQAFWSWWLRRYTPKSADVAERDRYIETGRRFWSDGDWFAAMLLAGYRGEVRQRELADLVARGGDVGTHPSIAEHRSVVARVRSLAGAA